jgi:hypothetical protein
MRCFSSSGHLFHETLTAKRSRGNPCPVVAFLRVEGKALSTYPEQDGKPVADQKAQDGFGLVSVYSRQTSNLLASCFR